MTATVLMEGRDGPTRVLCLLDQGAMRTFIHLELAQKLGLEVIRHEEMAIQPFGSKASEVIRMTNHLVRFKGSFSGAKTIQVEALTQKRICGESAYQRSHFATELKEKGFVLADNRVLSSSPTAETIGLLIDADYYWDIVEGGVITSRCGLRALTSKLGWLISGRPRNVSKANGSNHVISALIKASDKGQEEEGFEMTEFRIPEINPQTDHNYDLKVFWSLEVMGIKENGSEEKVPTSFDEFEANIKHLASKRYQTGIPWNEKLERLQPYREAALNRAKQLIEKFQRHPNKDLLRWYHEIFMGYLSRDVIGLPDPEYKGVRTYLPHWPVIKLHRKTTPVRPVMDASFKIKDGVSLNDCMETGPDYNPELLTVLLCFRLMPIVWIADIEKAFHQIELTPEDAEKIRFFWITDLNDPTNITEFIWKRLPFGLTASPYILRAVIRKHVMKYMNEYPETVRMILKLLYVDDQTSGHPTRESALNSVKQIQNIFTEAGMSMVKIISNDLELQKEVSGESNLEGIMSSLMNQKGETKVLGQGWDPMSDDLQYNADNIIAAANKIKGYPTKRQLLSISALLFDPMGLLAPVVLIAKKMFQELWKKNVGWDDKVTEDIGVQWNAFVAGLKDLNKIKIPRYTQGGGSSETKELHLFGDASEAAIGAAAYIVTEKEGTRTSHLLCAKSRVAPLEKQALPRLELASSLLAATLGDNIIQSTPGHNFERICCWSDSTSALGQIKGDLNKREKWVYNRSVSIRKLTSPEWWRHVPGIENPADLASRGTTPISLASSQLWWEGPEWLKLGEEHWPKAPAPAVQEIEEEKPQEVTVSVVATVPDELLYSKKEKARFDKCGRFVRVTAWVLRAFRAFRSRLSKYKDEEKISSNATKAEVEILVQESKECNIKKDVKILVPVLSTEEIFFAERFCLRQIQMEAFKKDYEALSKGESIKHKSAIRSLNPVWDPRDRLIRVTGCVEASYDQRQINPPILLPANDPIVKLIILATHERLLHAGVRSTLAEVREEFWIIRGRQQVKTHVSHCVKCRKQTSRNFDQVPAMLPLDRIKEAEAFEICGVDYAGPLYVWEDFLQEPEMAEKKKKSKDKEETEDNEIKGKGVKATKIAAKRQAKKKRLKMRKVYMLLFTCAVTRAVHVELVPDQTAHTFILALRNLFADRRTCSVIYSDNAKTFQKVNRYLRQLRRNPDVFDFLAQNKVKWKFSANLAPWWGGFWERMVRTLKLHIKKVLGKSYLNFFQLQTLLKEICKVVNSRPLCASSEADGEPTPLTPNHLIYGFRNTSLPSDPPPFIDGESANLESLLKRESRQRKLLKVFWSVWLKDYIGDLSKFAAPGATANESRRVPKVGELVLIHEASQKRVMWPVGIVDELIIGKDGRTRAVWLKVEGTERLNRPVQRLFPIEVQCGLDRDDELENRRKAFLAREKAKKKMTKVPTTTDNVQSEPTITEAVPHAADDDDINPVAAVAAPPEAVEVIEAVRTRKQTTRKEREARNRASVPEDLESSDRVQSSRSRRGREPRLPRHLLDYRI